MDYQASLTAENQRVYGARRGDIVSEEDMRPFLDKVYTVGARIELLRPDAPASGKAVSLQPTTTLFFHLTPQGWERVGRPKPSLLTPVIAWAAGGFFLLRSYLWHPPADGPNGDQNSHDIQVLMIFICFTAGLIMWAWDWWQYKHQAE